MSYQGTEWARNIPGKSGEKNVLTQLGHKLDQRTNRARVSEVELKRSTGLSERQVRRNLRKWQERNVVKQESGGRGPGNPAVYSFVGFKCSKGDIVRLTNRTFEIDKPDISAAKPDICDVHINRVRAREETSKELRKEHLKQHGFAELSDCDPDTARAISAWTRIRTQLKQSLPSSDSQWVRPVFLQRVMGDLMLLACPPDGRIVEKLRACDELQRLVREAGYGGAKFTPYTDDHDLQQLAERFPDAYASLPPALKKKRAQREIA
jgi:hypothetical protein